MFHHIHIAYVLLFCSHRYTTTACSTFFYITDRRITFKLAKLCYIWLLLSNSQAISLIWSAHTVSLACCDHPHRSFCQFNRTTWTLLLVVYLMLLWDFGTLFHWTVELLHPLTHLRSVLRHFSLIRHNRTVLWRDINLLIDWLFTLGYFSTLVPTVDINTSLLQLYFCFLLFSFYRSTSSLFEKKLNLFCFRFLASAKTLITCLCNRILLLLMAMLVLI